MREFFIKDRQRSNIQPHGRAAKCKAVLHSSVFLCQRSYESLHGMIQMLRSPPTEDSPGLANSKSFVLKTTTEGTQRAKLAIIAAMSDPDIMAHH